MTEEMVVSIVKDAFYYVILIAGPLLMVSLVIGLTVAIMQAATSISEQTLSFVPKVLAVFITTVLILPFMLSNMKKFTIDIFTLIGSL